MKKTMNRLLSIVCASAMVLSLCACGQKDEAGTSTEVIPELPPQDQTYTPPEQDGDIGGPAMMPDTPETVVPGTPEVGGSADIFGNAPPGGEALVPFDEEDSLKLAQIIRDTCTASEDITVYTGSECLEWLSALMDIDSNLVGAAAMAFPMASTRAYMVAIVRANINSDDYITASFQNYKQAQMDNFDQYLPDQYDIAQAANIFTSMPYMCFVMGENQSVADEIKEILEHPGEYTNLN